MMAWHLRAQQPASSGFESIIPISLNALGRHRTKHTVHVAAVNGFSHFSSDEILLQVFPRNLDEVSKDARTAGRLITGRDVNGSKYMSMDSKCARFLFNCVVDS